jgi:hypothetical protein
MMEYSAVEEDCKEVVEYHEGRERYREDDEMMKEWEREMEGGEV